MDQGTEGINSKKPKSLILFADGHLNILKGSKGKSFM